MSGDLGIDCNNKEIGLLKAAFSHLADGYAVYDPAARKLIAYSPAFVELLGCQETPDIFDESPFYFAGMLQPGFTAHEFDQYIQATLAGHPFHTKQRKANHTSPDTGVEVFAEKLGWNGGSLVMFKVQAAESGDCISAEGRSGSKEEGILDRMLRAVSGSPDLDGTCEIVCKLLADALHDAEALLSLTDSQYDYLEIKAVSQGVESSLVIGTRIPVSEIPGLSEWLKSGRSFSTVDVHQESDMEWINTLGNLVGFSSVATVPVTVRDQVAGVLCLGASNPRHYLPEEIRLAEDAAKLLSPLLELSQLSAQEQVTQQNRQKAEQELDTRERYLAALVEVQILLLRVDNPDLIYQQIMRSLGEASGADRAYLFVNYVGENGDLLTSQKAEWAAKGITPQLQNPKFQNMPFTDGLGRWFDILSQGIYLVGNVADFPESEQEILKPQDIESILVLPIIVRNVFFGFIGFDHCFNPGSWSPSEIALLKSAASSISLYEERRQASVALRESETRLLLMLDQLPAILWTTDLDLNITSNRGSGFAGLAADQRHQLLQEMVTAGGDGKAQQAHQSALKGQAIAYEMSIGQRVFQAYVEPFTSILGKVTGVLGIALDITERTQAEKALGLQRDFALRIMNNMGQGLMVTGPDGNFEFVNPAMAQLLGYQTDVLLNKTLQDVSFEEDHSSLLTAFQREDSSLLVQSLETRLRRVNGEVVYVLITDVPLVRDGKMTGSIIVVTDLTQRKKIETALRRSEEFMRELYTISSAREVQFSEKIQALLHMGCTHFGLEAGSLAQIEGDRYTVIEAYSGTGKVQRGMVMQLEDTFCLDVLETDRPLAFHHAGQDAARHSHPCYLRYGIEAYLGIKLTVAGELFGTLSFSSDSPKPEHFTATDEEFLRLMAQWISSEIEREQFLHQLQVSAREIAEKNEALALARDKALEVSQLKSEFLATMSHEIRTPMNAVIGMTDLLLDTDLADEQREYTQLIHESAYMLLTILNDILDFSKIEAGKLTLEKTVFELHPVIQGTVDLFQQKAAEKELKLALDISPEVPRLLVGDAVRLRQVLNNLVGNAIKFTSEGEVRVNAVLLAMDGQHADLRIEVCDSGIGISDEVQGQLFQPFTQADSSTTRKFGGTGLGLAICRRLVELMGGKIGVQSIPGKGSQFWFSIPYELAGNVKLMEEGQLRKRVAGTKVLVVSPNDTFSQYLHQQLCPWKIEVDLAKNASEAARLMQTAVENSHLYIAVLMDQMLTDGELQTIIAQTRNEGVQKQPALILLADGSGENPILPEKISKVFERPVHSMEVLQFIASLVPEEIEILRRFEGNNDKLAKETPEFTPGTGRILVADDNIANQRLALRQLKKLGYEVEIVSTGRQALEKLDLEPQRYDLVLMDCQMPEMDGFQATRQLRTQEQLTGQHMLVIAMTANAMMGDRELCIEAGMDDYISKPVKLEDLHAVLQKCHMTIKDALRTDEPAVLFDTSDLLDMATIQGVRELQMEGEPDIFQELVNIFLNESSSIMVKAFQAVEDKDAVQLRQMAHSIKGTSANVGAKLLSAQAAEIEVLAKNGDLQKAGYLLTALQDVYRQSCAALEAELG
jgi:PAS domain S-box-containing protein